MASKKPRKTAPLQRAKAKELVDDGTLISSSAVAHILGLERARVTRLVTSGKLPRPVLRTPGGQGRWSQYEIMQVRKAWERNADVDLTGMVDEDL